MVLVTETCPKCQRSFVVDHWWKPTMTKGQLIAALADLPDDGEVWLRARPETNSEAYLAAHADEDVSAITEVEVYPDECGMGPWALIEHFLEAPKGCD